jgi:hypothetical protein
MGFVSFIGLKSSDLIGYSRLDNIHTVASVGYGYSWVDFIQLNPTTCNQCKPDKLTRETRLTRVDPPDSERI